jgi:hypothetical protein
MMGGDCRRPIAAHFPAAFSDWTILSFSANYTIYEFHLPALRTVGGKFF